MLFDSDWAHSRSSSSVRNGESLMEVEMADISIDKPWRGISDLSIHVCTVHIDLSTISVDSFSHLMDSVFKFTSS